jgi:FkbM family methyltransferase
VARLLPNSPLRPLLRSAYRSLINLSTNSRGLECHLPGGESVRISPEFRYISWNPDEYSAFKQRVAPGDVVLDIGANVGCYSLLFGQWVGESGRVYAFEPAPETFSGLQKHIELNRLRAVVQPIAAAVSDTSDSADFLLNEHGGMSRLAIDSSDRNGTGTVQVATTTIDEFCSRENIEPRLIKVDVEGFELMVLRGGRETIKKLGSKLSLFVEMHPTMWRELGLAKEDLIAELDKQKLRAIPLGAASEPWTVEGECMQLVATT